MELFDRTRNMSDCNYELTQGVSNEIRDLTEEDLENTDDSLELILTSKFKIPEIILHDPYRKDGGYREVDISGDDRFWGYTIGENRPFYKKAKVVNVHIPFEGNADFLRMRPSRFQMISIRGEIEGKEIVVDFNFFPDSDSGESLKNEIKNEIDSIKKHMEWMNKDIRAFNSGLPTLISRDLKIRRDNLEKEKAIVGELDIPEREEDTAQKIGFVKPVHKIDVKVEHLSDSQDPVLENSIYEGITQHVNSLGINLERCKSRVRSLDEESLRDMFFMALNSAYKGLVSTEAFNHLGKTDILIRYEDKNLYVSEFKIWRSHEYFSEGIDQLLDNLTWRDSKCSYVIFSRNSDFSNVIEKAKELISKHPNHVKLIRGVSDSCFKFQFKNKIDSKKTFTLTLHLFDLA